MKLIYRSGLYWASWMYTLAIYVIVFFLAPVPMLVSAALVLALVVMSMRFVPIGYQGMPTFLGGRINKPIYVPEALNPLPLGWGLVRVLIVDRNTDLTETRPDDVSQLRELPEGQHYELTIPDKDNIHVRVRASIRWYISNLYDATTAGLLEKTRGRDGEGSTNLEDILIDFFRQVLLNVFRTHGWEKVSLQRESMAKKIKGALALKIENSGRSMGIVIIATPVTDVSPPKEILDAAAQKSVEKEQQQSQLTEADTYAQKRKRYIDAGVPEDRVDSVILANDGKLGPDKGFTVNHKIIDAPVVGKLAEAVAGAISSRLPGGTP